MTKEQYKIDIDGIYYLIFAVYTDYHFKKKDFPYDNLKSQIETYQMTKTPFDPNIHNIDDFMVDAYSIYDRYMSIEGELGNILGSLGMEKLGIDFLDLNEDKIREEFDKITGTFEDIIINCDFESPQIKGIQINFLKDKMKDAIVDENYELCAKLKNKIEKI